MIKCSILPLFFPRDFKLRLKRDTLVFSPDLGVVTSRGSGGYDVSRAYVGHVKGMQNDSSTDYTLVTNQVLL